MIIVFGFIYELIILMLSGRVSTVQADSSYVNMLERFCKITRLSENLQSGLDVRSVKFFYQIKPKWKQIDAKFQKRADNITTPFRVCIIGSLP